MSTKIRPSGATPDDPLVRLLLDEGARFRAGHRPPSLDDAVRRLGPGGQGSPRAGAARRARRTEVGGSRRSGSRVGLALLAAAAVLLVVVGGATLVEAVRGDRPTSVSGPPPPFVAATLTPPSGFVPRTSPVQAGPSVSPDVSCVGNVVVHTWQRPTRGSGAPDDLLTLRLTAGPEGGGAGTTVDVRGHQAVLQVLPGSTAGAPTTLSVTWNEDPVHRVDVTLVTWATHGPQADAAVLLSAARSFDPGVAAWPPRPQPGSVTMCPGRGRLGTPSPEGTTVGG